MTLCETPGREGTVRAADEDVRHGMRNHLLSILAYAERGEGEAYPVCNRYNRGWQAETVRRDQYREYRDRFPGRILEEKAEDAGIEFLTDLSIPMEMSFRGADISLIMGNLLENAVEGAGRAEGRKYIRLKMKYDKNNLLITIENSYRGKLAKGEGGTENNKNGYKQSWGSACHLSVGRRINIRGVVC